MSEPAAHPDEATLPRPDTLRLQASSSEPDSGDPEAPSPWVVPLTGDEAVEAFYLYAQTAEFRRRFEDARGLDAEQLADRARRRQRDRARRAAAAIAARRPSG